MVIGKPPVAITHRPMPLLQPEGEGIYCWSDGSVYAGSWHEGLKHGWGERGQGGGGRWYASCRVALPFSYSCWAITSFCIVLAVCREVHVAQRRAVPGGVGERVLAGEGRASAEVEKERVVGAV